MSVNKNKEIIFYLFHSPTNGDSQLIRTILRKVIPEDNRRIILREVDFDNEKDICDRFNVYGIPTLLIQSGQNEIQRFSGVLNVEEVKKIINESLVKRN
jgi:thioredoxin-like negative regulator of GroEL